MSLFLRRCVIYASPSSFVAAIAAEACAAIGTGAVVSEGLHGGAWAEGHATASSAHGCVFLILEVPLIRLHRH